MENLILLLQTTGILIASFMAFYFADEAFSKGLTKFENCISALVAIVLVVSVIVLIVL